MVQQFSPALDLPFKTLTFMGDEAFYLLFMPLVYWSIDRRTGAGLFILLLFSAYLNAVAKVIADQPRPFNYDVRVRPLDMPVAADCPAVTLKMPWSSGDTWPVDTVKPSAR